MNQWDEIDRSISALCAREIGADYLTECDQTKRYPAEAMRLIASAGWAAVAVPGEYGGAGGTRRDLAVIHRALSRHSLAIGQAYFSLWVLGAEAISRLGSDVQKAQWLPRIATGEAWIAFALTEPGSGSDAAALSTVASPVAGGYRVSGQKVFITGAAIADTIITVTRTDRTAAKHAGLSTLLIDPHLDGVTIRKLDKIGLRSLDLCEVFFDDVFVADTDLLGTEGSAWSNLRAGLAAERTFIAAICVGALEDVVRSSATYARERTAFGQEIGRYQMIGQKVVDMDVASRAAWLLTDRAAQLIDAGEDASVAAATAKLFASEAYVSATREGVQIFGGYGYTEEYPIARHYRDAKFTEIGAGTSEIQRLVIGRSLGVM